jgi:hypothetical protein
MSATFAITRRVRINATLTAEMSVGPDGFAVTWIGPVPRRLTAGERRRYRQARDQLIAEFAAQTGLKIMLVETT